MKVKQQAEKNTLPSQRGNPHQLPLSSMAYPLEPRIMFDAAVAATGAEIADTSDADSLPDTTSICESGDSAPHSEVTQEGGTLDSDGVNDTAAGTANESKVTEVVFINSSVLDSDKIVDDLSEDAAVIYLESGEDAVQVITDYLSDKSGIETVRIISHGNEGFFVLNGQIIDSDFLADNAETFSEWGSHLAEDGDIMLYGCNLAANGDGQALVDNLASLTGADVAASTDITGGADGNWQLEYVSGMFSTVEAERGTIEAIAIFVDEYDYQLTTYIVDDNGDGGTGSGGIGDLRYCITEINAGAGGDEIIFTLSSGDEVVTLASELPTLSKAVTINGDNISGSGVQVTVDGNGAYRVFTVNTTVSLENLTITNGLSTSSGGGIYNTATLSLTNCTISDNATASGYNQGGGIYNTGTITVVDCTISGNSAGYYGGGIYNDATGSISTIENCTVSGNLSGSHGAGIMNSGTIDAIANCTISGNLAGDYGGGIFNSGTVSVINCTISGNTADTNGYGTKGAGVFNQATMTIRNTIIAQNVDSAIVYDYFASGGTLTDGGYNVVGYANVMATATNGFSSATSMLYNTRYNQNGTSFTAWSQGGEVMTNQTLGLANTLALNDSTNGTMTLALSTDSFAVGAIDYAAGSNTWNNSASISAGDYYDQRGNVIEAGNAISIGAYSIFAPKYYYKTDADGGNWSDALTWTRSLTIDGTYEATAIAPTLGNAVSVTITSGAEVTVVSGDAANVDTLTIEESGGLVLNTGGALTIEDGAGATDFAVKGTLDMDGGTLAVAGTLTYGALSTLVYSDAAAAQVTSSTELPATGTVNVTINNANGVTLGTSTSISGNLAVNTGSFTVGDLNLSVGGNAEVTGNMYIGNGTVDVNGGFDATGGRISFTGAGNLNLGAAVTSLGIFNAGIGTVTYDGAASQTVISAIYNNLVTAGAGFKTLSGTVIANNNVTVASGTTLAAGANTLSITGNTDINGTLTASTGTIDANGGFDATGGNVSFTGAGYLNLGSTVTSLGTFTAATSTVSYDAGGDQAVASATYYNLTTAGGGTKTFNGSATVNNTLTTGAGTTLSLGADMLLLGSSSAGTGGWIHNGGFDAGTGTVVYGEAGDQTIVSETYYNLATVGSSGVKSLGGAVTVEHALTTGAGTTLSLGANTLTLGSANSGSGSWSHHSGFDAGTGTFVYGESGNQTIVSETYYNLETGGSGTKSLSSDITVENTLTTGAGTTLSLGANTLTIGSANSGIGGWINNGLFTAGTGTVVYGETGNQTIALASYYNLTTSGSGTKTLGGSVTVENNLITGTGTTLSLDSSSLAIGSSNAGTGSWTLNGDFSADTGTVVYGETASQTVHALTYHNLSTAGSGIKTLEATLGVTGDLTVGSGTTLAVAENSVVVDGNADINGNLTASSGTIDVDGSFDATGGVVSFTGAGNLNLGAAVVSLGTFTAGAGTVTYNGAGDQTVAAATYNNLKTSGSGTKSLGGNSDINGTLTIGASTVLDVTANNYTINLAGDWVNSGTFTERQGTVILDGADQAVGSDTFYNLIINGSGTKSLGGQVTVDNGLTVNSGTVLSVGANTLGIGGNADINGTLTASTGRIDVDGSFDATGANVTFTGDARLELASSIVSLGTFTASTGTVVLDGTVEQGLASGTNDLYNLEVDNSAGAVLMGNLTITNDLFLTSGNIRLSDYTMRVDGEIRGSSGNTGRTDFSSSNMIVVSGTGTLIRMIDSDGDYLMPIGTDSGTAEYSPIIIGLSGGSYAADASLSAAVDDVQHAEDPSSSEYLARYWTLSSSGITDFSADVTVYYLQSDVVGDEAAVYGSIYDSSVWGRLGSVAAADNSFTGTVTEFGDFSGIANREPSLSLTDQSPAFTEVDGADDQSGAVVINSSISISDPDMTDPASASVIITNFKPGDELLFADTANIEGHYTNGVLTLTAVAGQSPTTADFEAALSSVRFNNTSDLPDTSVRTITFQVTDTSASESSAATETVTVSSTNDTPVIELAASEPVFTEVQGVDDQSGAVIINGAVSIIDLDGTAPVSATVTITNLMAGDELLFTDSDSVQGVYVDGVLTLTAIAGKSPSEADFEAALSSVRFNNTSETPDTTDRIIAFKITDAAGANSAPINQTVIIQDTNEQTSAPGEVSDGNIAPVVEQPYVPGEMNDRNMGPVVEHTRLFAGDETPGAGGLGFYGLPTEFSAAADMSTGIDPFTEFSPGDDLFIAGSFDSFGENIPNVNLIAEEQVQFPLPANSFADQGDSQNLHYNAYLEGGAALPVWLELDPESGFFHAEPPAGFEGILDVIVEIEDEEGRTISQHLQIIVEQKGKQAGVMPFGKPSFADQLAGFQQGSGVKRDMHLLERIKDTTVFTHNTSDNYTDKEIGLLR